MPTEATVKRMKYREGRLRTVAQARGLQDLIEAGEPRRLHKQTGEALVRRGLATASANPRTPWVTLYEVTDEGTTFFDYCAEVGMSPIS